MPMSAVTAAAPPLDAIAMVALDAGRLLMEAGASAANTERMIQQFAVGLGAERIEVRVGYASRSATVGIGGHSTSRMRRVGVLGVDQRRDQAVCGLGARVACGELTIEQTAGELDRIVQHTARHQPWVMAVAGGVGCAAFGRLLTADWPAFAPVLLAATISQALRRELLRVGGNGFLVSAIVAFVSATLAGLGARLCDSATTSTAMLASILHLVPGVPALNAQNDILDGHPTLGSARAVTVAMTLVFAAAGLWCARLLVQPAFGT